MQYAETLAVGESDDGQEEADAHARRELDRPGNGTREPLAEAEEGQSKEDETLYEGGGQCDGVRRVSGTVETDYVIGEVCVQS